MRFRTGVKDFALGAKNHGSMFLRFGIQSLLNRNEGGLFRVFFGGFEASIHREVMYVVFALTVFDFGGCGPRNESAAFLFLE